MAEEIEVTEETLEDEGPNPMLDLARKVVLATIGAVALTQEELEKFVHKLIERGEIAEHDGKKLIKDAREKRRSKTDEVRSGTEGQIDRRMEDILGRMNIPSKSDIESLSQKISTLSDKIDELGQE
ncbi:MAG TPA: phasin family protein [candidate division Zixibacteria bacterium]|nr:phasin family protein [candidate division Zixibacteria bacterium]